MMRLDRSDMSSLTAIAFGGVMGLLGTGLLVERMDDARDRRVEVRMEHVIQNQVWFRDGLTIEAGRVATAPRIRVRVRDMPAVEVERITSPRGDVRIQLEQR